MAKANSLSVNDWLVKQLEVAVAPSSVADAPSAEGKAHGRFARIVALVGPTGGYAYHPHEVNVKQTIERERWVEKFRLPFTEADIIAACYVAGDGDPWAGFVDARVREQLNDELDGVGSRAAVLRARLKEIARVS